MLNLLMQSITQPSDPEVNWNCTIFIEKLSSWCKQKQHNSGAFLNLCPFTPQPVRKTQVFIFQILYTAYINEDTLKTSNNFLENLKYWPKTKSTIRSSLLKGAWNMG